MSRLNYVIAKQSRETEKISQKKLPKTRELSSTTPQSTSGIVSQLLAKYLHSLVVRNSFRKEKGERKK